MADKKKKTAKKAGPLQKTAKNYLDLFYMTPQQISARELADTLKENEAITVELWPEMNVLELVLPNENSIDFEALPVNFTNASDAAFVKNRNIQTIFAINLCEDDLAAATPLFEQLAAKHSGFVCADSEDFTPVYAGSSKK